jgi:hypothetical protein
MSADAQVAMSKGTRTTATAVTWGGTKAVLKWQTDGNLVIYCRNGGQAVWASGTNGLGRRFVFQKDGNLVIYDKGGRPLWASDTDGHSTDYAVMQDDGNFVIYTDSKRQHALWSTKTYRSCK